jgi:hypothetical protein
MLEESGDRADVCALDLVRVAHIDRNGFHA